MSFCTYVFSMLSYVLWQAHPVKLMVCKHFPPTDQRLASSLKHNQSSHHKTSFLPSFLTPQGGAKVKRGLYTLCDSQQHTNTKLTQLQSQTCSSRWLVDYGSVRYCAFWSWLEKSIVLHFHLWHSRLAAKRNSFLEFKASVISRYIWHVMD